MSRRGRAILYDGDRTKDVGAYVAVETHSNRSGLDNIMTKSVGCGKAATNQRLHFIFSGF
jgi:hypothetical protein